MGTKGPSAALLFALVIGDSVSSGSGFTLRAGLSVDITEDRVFDVPGTYEATARNATGDCWAVLGAAFKP